jgi:hypothetical protein
VATSPRSLASVVLSDSVVDAVRKELRRRTGQQLDGSAVVKLLRTSVIRSECLE